MLGGKQNKNKLGGRVLYYREICFNVSFISKLLISYNVFGAIISFSFLLFLLSLYLTGVFDLSKQLA